jgi:hypothetical protein
MARLTRLRKIHQIELERSPQMDLMGVRLNDPILFLLGPLTTF